MLPTEYQNFVYLSRYARWREFDKRRETWDETVERYCNFWKKRYGDQFPYERVYKAILNLDVMPSMRSLMTAGPALDRDEMAGYNPVTGSTRIITKDGNFCIKDLENKPVEVLNKDGCWAAAVVRSYGEQPIYKVTTKLNSNTVKETECTINHRWVLSDGTVKSTDALLYGDSIGFQAAKKPDIDEDYMLGIRHGIVYGDGTATKSNKRVKGFMLRLCGNSKELLSYFDGYPRSYPKSANGDPVVYFFDSFAATTDLKALPSYGESDSYLLGFVRGWLAADGSVGKTGSRVTLCTNDKGLEWLRNRVESLGFIIQRVYQQSSVTNYGVRTHPSFIVAFSRSSIIEEDLLCSWKRDSFKPLNSHWVVSSVEKTGTNAPVFCAEVPDTNTFVLEGGLVTGNCSALPIDHPRAFDEILYVLMCGTGVGFSVESKYVNQLPVVPELFDTDTTIVVADSKIGWATALRQLIGLLYSGSVPTWDISRLRPYGARLKVFGGRASGPAPLVDMMQFVVNTFRRAQGRRLTPIECHDIACKIADCVVVGGVRRSALISLSDLSDQAMRDSKSGQWYDEPDKGIIREGQRALANNSAVYETRPDMDTFLAEWTALVASKSGERGFFNRKSSRLQALATGRRDVDQEFLTNPCGEIILRPYGLCNLSEVVVRYSDTLEDIKEKVEVATIIGTFQSTLTNFKYVRQVWRKNAEEERLLGVSMTGIMDHKLLSGRGDTAFLSEFLSGLKQHAINVNAFWAGNLGINASSAITTVKPSGTVSQLVDSASGIHPRWNTHYIRTVRADKKDPLAKFMRLKGFPVENEQRRPDVTDVFSFPIQTKGIIVKRTDVTAIQQLEHYLVFKRHWCEHNPSITVYVKDDEWLAVGDWLYKNFDEVGGVSFLPHSDHIYAQAPYQDITKEEYEVFLNKMPKNVDWTELGQFEDEDNTSGSQELACLSGVCEIV